MSHSIKHLLSPAILLAVALSSTTALAEKDPSILDHKMDRKVVHQVENHFYCDLKPGKTMRDVYKVQSEWMALSAKLGFSLEDYDSAIIFPIFAEKTTTVPNRVKWVGKFKDFKGEGMVMQAFMDSGFENGIRTVLNCHKAEQWFNPQGSYP
ncbi:MAG: hypothetical protein OXC05_03510 [Halieaceae bacterium]|nr:hypothetical protein [Halieaceae bacterium]